jgi:hypothetical protein
MQDSELIACKNVWIYKIGKLQKVPGYAKCYDSQVVDDRVVRYLHHYYDTSSSTDYMLAVSNDSTNAHLTLKYRTTGAWSTISGISTSWNTYVSSSVSMVNYLGKTFIVGHKTGSTFVPNATVDGTAFSIVDTDITSMPQGKFIVRYRDLLYVLYPKNSGTVYPSRAYYCDEPVGGTIGWTGLTVNFVEFGYDDGDEITGGAEALDRLVVFKHYSMWKYDESSVIKIADVGCDSYRSIVNIKGILYWTNRQGAWRWTGSQPEFISAKAQPFFDAIDQTKLNEQVACIYNEDEYRVFIGDVTVDEITYSNAWYCFNTRTERQYIRCTYNEVKSCCTYIESGARRAYFGDDDGYVYKFATAVDGVYADNGQEIDSFFITKALDHGVPEDTKFTNHMTVFSNYAVGMQIAVEKDNAKVYSQENVPVLSNNIEHIDLTASANRFRYKFYEKGTSKSWELEGFVIRTDLKEQEF